VDPNLARAIAADAAAAPGARVVEVGAGLGSLTVALAKAGAQVLAIEFDRRLLEALGAVVSPWPAVRIVSADALAVDWRELLEAGAWTMASNLPYGVGVPVLLRMLEDAPQISTFVVMVQREVADRLAAAPGSAAYGAVSAKIAYDAEVETLRRIPREVFWPRPRIESSVLRLTRRARPPVDVERRALFAVIDVAFGERRKTITNAVRRLGLDARAAARALEEAGVEAGLRPEQLGLDGFARLAAALERAGVVGGA
jgi:16S rRNA (adenine1518-N6/adenine1519-N6)-dimethyltransferase